MTMLALLCTAVVGIGGGARLVSVLLAMFPVWPFGSVLIFSGCCALAGARRQCVPGRERVHIVPPVRDFPVFNLDD